MAQYIDIQDWWVESTPKGQQMVILAHEVMENIAHKLSNTEDLNRDAFRQAVEGLGHAVDTAARAIQLALPAAPLHVDMSSGGSAGAVVETLGEPATTPEDDVPPAEAVDNTPSEDGNP